MCITEAPSSPEKTNPATPPLTSPGNQQTVPDLSIAPPDHPVKLIFLHHSSGENWLKDNNGGLGIALRDNNYFVSDTNYGWGPVLSPAQTRLDHIRISATGGYGSWARNQQRSWMMSMRKVVSIPRIPG